MKSPQEYELTSQPLLFSSEKNQTEHKMESQDLTKTAARSNNKAQGLSEHGVFSSLKMSFYYPSEREQSCWGKGPFRSRFPIQQQMRKSCFCTLICKALCLFCCTQKINEPKDQAELERLLPMTVPTFTVNDNKITYTWIGHSTAVLAIGNQANLMIDPIFSMRCSPVQFAGPKRYRMPACQISKLPNIHSVLVSHDHFDHLDEKSLEALEKLYRPHFIAGLDSEDSFPQGCRLTELDWTQTKEININGHKFEITFVPVCHWSKRKFYERNTRLWGGFVIKTPKGHKIFYPGDTAYCEIFKQIGQKFGPFDLAILPIGAYLPRDFMESSHIDPQQAVIIHQELRSKKSVGVHWGTFPLGFEHWHQPRQDLAKAKKKYNIPEDEFVAIGHGQHLEIDYL